jgi:chromosomal replication initiator protein
MLTDAVAARVGAARYGLWFAGHARFVHLGGEVIIAVRNQHSQDWLEHTFGQAVKEATIEVFGAGTAVKWVVDVELFQESEDRRQETGDRRQETEDRENRGQRSEVRSQRSEIREDNKAATPRLATAGTGASKSVAKDSSAPRRTINNQQSTINNPHTPQQTDLFGNPVPVPQPKAKRGDSTLGLAVTAGKAGRRWKFLNEFVVGPCNRVAHASALSVVEEPGEGANPLIIHGPVGTGKTHLLEGIYAGLRRKSDQRPCYVTAEEFTTKFVAASQHGKMAAFRRQFRECSALLLDDLHFLATRKATQAEFLHTFDALVSDGRQVVVTTDCHPRLADELMPELVDRLLGGAVWGLLPPDPETRLEILRKKSTGVNPAIPDPVLKSLASSLRGNVRELEGAVNSVRHYAKVTGRPVDQTVVREALGDLLQHAVRVVTVADVDAAVCAVLRLASGTLQSKSRAWAVTHPRMIAIYLCRKHTAATYGEISKHFGAKTHSTAVAAEKKVRVWLDKNQSVAIGDRDWQAKELLDRIERELQR